jgi:hypothetical protein
LYTFLFTPKEMLVEVHPIQESGKMEVSEVIGVQLSTIFLWDFHSKPTSSWGSPSDSTPRFPPSATPWSAPRRLAGAL